MRALYWVGVDDAHIGLDAELAEILDERHRMGLERARGIEELDGQRLAARQLQDIAVALAAGRDEEIVGLLEQLAVEAGAIALRRDV